MAWRELDFFKEAWARYRWMIVSRFKV